MRKRGDNKENGGRDYLSRLRAGEPLKNTELSAMILKLSLPSIMAQISTIIMQYIDASMVGRLGAAGSAAIGLVSSTTWLFGGIAMATGMGFTVQCAQRIGAGDEGTARNLMKEGLVITLIAALLMGAAGAAISMHLPVWLGGEAAIYRDAGLYFLVFALFFPIDRINFLAGSFLQASGNMKTPGALHVLMCVLDVVFNAFLIFPGFTVAGIDFPGLGLGVMGAALGTGLAKLVSLIFMLTALLVRSPMLHLRKGEKMSFIGSEIRRSIRIAVPVALENIIMNTAQITSTRIVAPLGTVSVAANSLSITAESLCYMPGFGIAAAATTVVGQSIGAGRKDLTRKIGWLSTALGMLVMTGSGMLLYIFAPVMIGWLSPDAAVIALGAAVLRIEAFAEPMYAASIVANGVLRGGGDTLIPAVVSLICMWCIRLPLASHLALSMGLQGVWIAMCIELCIRGVLFLIRQAQGKYA